MSNENKKLFKATFIEVDGVWVEDTNIPREPIYSASGKLTSDEIMKMLKTFTNQNQIWEKLGIKKQQRLVE